jgi:hypothetical protein
VQDRARFTAETTALVQVILALVQGLVLQAAWDPSLDVGRHASACTAVLDAYLGPGSPSPSLVATDRAQR